MLYIGIDAGVSTGLCLYNPLNKQIINIETTTFWGVIELIETLLLCRNRNMIKVFVEDPSQNKPVFGRKVFGQNAKKIQKIAQNVGQNKREATLIMEYCERNKIPFQGIKPTKNTHTKLDKDKFQRITGYDKRTSEHGRDACMLVYGRV